MVAFLCQLILIHFRARRRPDHCKSPRTTPRTAPESGAAAALRAATHKISWVTRQKTCARRAVGASKTHSARASTQRARAPIARQTPPTRARRSERVTPLYLLGAGLSKDQAVRVWEQLDENKNGKVSYPEFKAWAQDKLADVAVDDINYTTRSNVDVGQIKTKAASKIGA